jgi:hypothetical protein
MNKQQRASALQFAAAVNVALMEMSGGAALHCEHVGGTRQWRLSNGRRIPERVAQAVIQKKSVVSVGDSLFCDGVAQTYRFAELTKKRRGRNA